MSLAKKHMEELCFVCGSPAGDRWQVAFRNQTSGSHSSRERGWDWQSVCGVCQGRLPDPNGIQRLSV